MCLVIIDKAQQGDAQLRHHLARLVLTLQLLCGVVG